MKIGFSTGALHKAPIEQNSNDAVEAIRRAGANALEIGCISVEELDQVEKLDSALVKSFDYLSFHAPAMEFEYQKNESTKRVLDRIVKLKQEFGFENVIFHPDRIVQMEVLDPYSSEFVIVIENMNSNKPAGRSVEEMKQFLDGNNYGMLLDLQHVYSNDLSMKLAGEFYGSFGDRIVEIHISGQTEKPGQHAPLFEWGQEEIVKAIPSKSLPIIIESPVKETGDLKFEFEYVLSLLAGLP